MQPRRELRLTHLTPDGASDVVLSGRCDSVGQLALALRGCVEDLVIDGRLHPAHASLDSVEIGSGSVIGGPVRAAPRPQWRLAVVSGPAAGALLPLDSGRVEVGRDLLGGDPTVSGRHFVLDRDGEAFEIADIGSTNGTFVDGYPVGASGVELGHGAVITAGATRLRLESPSLQPPMSQRDRNHHRPPRRPLPPPPPPIELPPAPSVLSSTSRFSWTAVIAPLLLGLGMAQLFDWRMAAFALLSPLLGIGTWAEDRRRARHDRRAAALATSSALDHFRGSLAAAAAGERARRDALVPGAAACIDRVRSGAAEIWERRRGDLDFGLLRLGRGPVQWQPELSHPAAASPLDEALAEARSQTIVDCPTGVSVGQCEVVGICGDRSTALAVARSLVVQATTLHGPADLAIAVRSSAHPASEWDWVKWLPHHEPERTTDDGRLLLTIVDDPAGQRGPIPAPHRSAIVLAGTREDLPASCSQIVSINDPPVATLENGEHPQVTDIVMDGVSREAAEEAARALAPLVDPEAQPQQETHPTLLDVVAARTCERIRSRWAGGDQRHLRASIGFHRDAPMSVDLVGDGPHALVAGTTGSGKSELLRTWVASLASAYGPDRLTFFLVDYKGGSAFDACARLPHVVGSVTDLDDRLAERALVSLDAELSHRERRLRQAGATDINSWPGSGDDPMPRLVIVIDEFAALQRDLPDFMDALVQIAQRGRSLGVHLVLATQRPQGVVSDSIRANTNLRICLRVQDSAESHDVIGAPDAASLIRPGMAVARVGNDALRAFEVAHSSASDKDEIEARPFHLAGAVGPEHPRDAGATTQLELLVDAIVSAANGLAPPRRPWLPPLPTEVDLAALPAGVAAVVDDPANQRQLHWRWEAGALLLYGSVGAGMTTALRSLAVGLARSAPPDDVHIYALDFGAGGMNDLALLPHTGGVISGADTERVVRCITWLHDVVRERQRAGRCDGPRIVVLVDGWSAFASGFDSIDGLVVRDRLLRVATEGAAVGVDVAVSGESPIAIPTSLAMAVPAKVVFRLADRYDYAALGLPPREAVPNPGACVDATTGLTMQFGLGDPSAFADATRWPPADGAPVAIEAFSPEVKLADVIADLAADAASEAFGASGRMCLPLGLREDGRSACVELGPSEHLVVIGHRGTGRSTALATVAESLRAAAPELRVVAIGDARSPLAGSVAIDRWVDLADGNAAQAVIEDLLSADDDAVILIDDAERCAGAESLDRLVESRPAHLRVFAATRPDVLRSSYGHWLHRLRSNAVMLLLEPGGGPDAHALVGRPLPRRPFVPAVPGRGELICDGDSTLVQVALP